MIQEKSANKILFWYHIKLWTWDEMNKTKCKIIPQTSVEQTLHQYASKFTMFIRFW
jgi:L-arabinose isomerase